MSFLEAWFNDVTANTPRKLDYATAEASDVLITMGCGDVCPVFPGKRYLDWKLDDPAGQGIDAVRSIRRLSLSHNQLTARPGGLPPHCEVFL